ncbi:hypothetical protein Y1Q_0023665 [Alligator mississippiensis]|uniref:Uncharacterized protein n=1 Tax=Alligator mississippiensis TaxID=8496 RepID=A0A151P2W1_ALLMI|nr:hypothetical protein Y1Q_0023665 [Alligator mississippiensis]
MGPRPEGSRGIMIIAVYLVLGAVTLASTAPTPNLCQHQDQPPGIPAWYCIVPEGGATRVPLDTPSCIVIVHAWLVGTSYPKNVLVWRPEGSVAHGLSNFTLRDGAFTVQGMVKQLCGHYEIRCSLDNSLLANITLVLPEPTSLPPTVHGSGSPHSIIPGDQGAGSFPPWSIVLIGLGILVAVAVAGYLLCRCEHLSAGAIGSRAV